MGGGTSRGEVKSMMEAKAICKAAIRGTDGVTDQEEQVFLIFKDWDVDGSGLLSTDELLGVFDDIGYFPSTSDKERKKQIAKLLKDMDIDRDGSISFQELIGFIFQAPFLQEYLKYSKKVLMQHIRDRIGKDGGDLDSLKAAQRAQLEEELIPIIKNTCAFHDKDGSGKLDKSESIVFFSNYAALLPSLHTHLLYETASIHDAVEAIDLYDKWSGECSDRSRLDKRFQAAFSLLDVSNDGMLEVDEVIAGLLHGSEKNVALMNALEIPVLA